jgi:ubiquinone/menaquinone biosynthesis C-methylase UbiE
MRLAQAFPDARIVGIDFDATLLALARARCAELGDLVSFVEEDLRSSPWHA